jgi:hypothetical protein
MGQPNNRDSREPAPPGVNFLTLSWEGCNFGSIKKDVKRNAWELSTSWLSVRIIELRALKA